MSQEQRQRIETPYIPRGFPPPTVPLSKYKEMPEPPKSIGSVKVLSPDTGFTVDTLITNALVARKIIEVPYPCRMVTILADQGNVGTIFYGYKQATFPLIPRAAKDIMIDDASKIYIMGNSVGDIAHIAVEGYTQ